MANLNAYSDVNQRRPYRSVSSVVAAAVSYRCRACQRHEKPTGAFIYSWGGQVLLALMYRSTNSYTHYRLTESKRSSKPWNAIIAFNSPIATKIYRIYPQEAYLVFTETLYSMAVRLVLSVDLTPSRLEPLKFYFLFFKSDPWRVLNQSNVKHYQTQLCCSPNYRSSFWLNRTSPII